MIRRGYTPPFQTPAPKLGADDMGRTVKGLVNVEIERTNEVSFAVESFGCDGKPVLSMLRDLPCEATGKLVVAGTKNGMPFKLNSDLPRGIGSAIRGSGGAMRTLSAGAAYRTSEWVLYDNFGNYWSLDELTGGKPTYRGATPPLAAGDGLTPALCVQAPGIRPYELRWEYVLTGGDPEVNQPAYYPAGAGWQPDDGSPVIVSTVAYPYAPPAHYWRIEQWIPDETTPPTGAEFSGAWPTSKRRVDCLWYPARTDVPHDWDSVTENSIDVIVSKYPTEAPWLVHMNQWTRPLLEHISTGATADEMPFVICVEKDIAAAPHSSRVALRGKNTGELLGSLAFTARSDGRHMLTPDRSEGWFLQTGVISTDTVQLRRLRSRATSGDDFGSSLSAVASLYVTLPAASAVSWSEPVWFRVGKAEKFFGASPRLTPRLPRWR